MSVDGMLLESKKIMKKKKKGGKKIKGKKWINNKIKRKKKNFAIFCVNLFKTEVSSLI